MPWGPHNRPPAVIDMAAPKNENGPMAQVTTPNDVRLICGMISADVSLMERASDEMARLFSPIDHVSDLMDFSNTHYYDRQMGSPLYRQFVSFSRPVKPDAVVGAKVATNELEARFAAELAGPGRPVRPINLDPGYIDRSKLVLASMKNFSHRIYLSDGVYAEVTLMYHRTGWQAFPWTFPDYGAPQYHPFLTEVRTHLHKHLQEIQP